MTVDSNKIAYYSGWDIDQLLTNTEVAVGSGDTALYSTLIPLPEYEVQFKPTGSTYWYQAGTASTDGTTTNLFTFYSYITGSSIHIKTTSTGTARYFVWADKIDY